MKLKISIKNKARFNKIPLSLLKNQDGVTAVLVAIVLAMLLGFTALAVDVGYMYSTRNELQNVADAAALAGAGELGRIYLTLDMAKQKAFNVDFNDPDPIYATYRDRIEAVVQDTASQNKAAGESINIDPEEIFIGTWVWDATPPYLNVGVNPPDAVRVIARRDATINSPVATFFAKILSIFGGSADTFEASAVATAALSGPATVSEGELITPVGISDNFFEGEVGDPCLTLIEFSPTTSSCAGWHNFFDPINAAASADKLIGFIEGYKDDNGTDYTTDDDDGDDWLKTHFDINKAVTVETTPATDGETFFEFQGGAIASLFLGGHYKTWVDKDTPVDSDPETTPDTIDPFDNAKKPAPFINLFDFNRFRDGDGYGVDSYGNLIPLPLIQTCDGPKDPDDVWTATVPVYDEPSDGCTNPNTSIKIRGYAKIQILMPSGPPNTNIVACVNCDFLVVEGRGGGGIYGELKGSIPNLVE